MRPATSAPDSASAAGQAKPIATGGRPTFFLFYPLLALDGSVTPYAVALVMSGVVTSALVVRMLAVEQPGS